MKKNKRGIGLIDTIVGSFIIALSILIITQIYIYGTSFLYKCKMVNKANDLCKSVLEVLRNSDYDSIDDYCFAYDNKTFFPKEISAYQSLGYISKEKQFPNITSSKDFGIFTTVQNADASLGKIVYPPFGEVKPKIKKIIVTVKWLEKERTRVVNVAGYARKLY